MSENDEGAKIIPFPIRRSNDLDSARKNGDLPDKIMLSEEGAHDLVLAVSSINMATKYKGEFDDNCKRSLETENFPCNENCGCYLHMLSSMALEIVLGGPRENEAKEALRNEYCTLMREGPKKKDGA